jgi:flagellar hook-length control protein FliK
MNLDFLARLSALDPTHGDGTANKTASSQAAFGDYLQRAQSQSNDTAPSSRASGSTKTNDATESAKPSSAKEPAAEAGTAAGQHASHSADRKTRRTTGNSSSRKQNATPAASQHDSSPSASAQQDTPTASQDHRNSGSHDSTSGSSNQDSNASTDTAQKDDSHKVATGDAAASAIDGSAVAMAAAKMAPIADGNPSGGTQGTTDPVPASTNSGGTAPRPVTQQAPQINPSAEVHANNQGVLAQPAAAPTVAADTTAPATRDPSSTTIAAAAAGSSGEAHPAKPGDRSTAQDAASAIDSIAAAAAVTPANPAVSATAPPADPKPLPAVSVNGVPAATNANASATAPTNEITTMVPDAQAAREQRAKAAAEALTQSDSDSDTTAATGKPAAATAAPTAAAPQTGTHGVNSTGGSAGTSPAAETSLSQSDRVRFVQRVEQAFQDLNSQGGSVRLRLSPPELGSLHIEIHVAKGEMTARVQAESPAARNILLDNLPALRDRLAQHDIKVQRFDVDLMDRSNGGMSNQSSQYQNPSPQRPSNVLPRAPLRGSGELPGTVAAPPARPASSAGRLNVIV